MGCDTWRLHGPDDRHEVGTHDGETCGRYEQPDEDAPRGYKPKPCSGVMMHDGVDTCGCDDCIDASTIVCDTCGALT